MSLAENLRAARKEAKLSQPRLAKLADVSQSLISQIETGLVLHTKELFKLARALKKRPAELDEDAEEFGAGSISSEQAAVGQTRLVAPDRDPSLVPMYSVVEGGDGSIVTSWDVVQYVRRPEELQGVRDGYGMYVVGESMEPLFKRGHKVFADPHAPPRADDPVLLFQNEIGQPTKGLIKVLLRPLPSAWKVEQFNPRKKFALSRGQWPVCHVVVSATFR